MENTLALGMTRTIVQVTDVWESGVLDIKGPDGTVHKEHLSNCLPCHLPLVERGPGQLEQLQGHPDLHLALQVQSPPCAVCFGQLDEDPLIVCDHCEDAWHADCLTERPRSEGRLPRTCPSCNLA